MRFICDVDEVLADFAGHAISLISATLGREWTIEEAPKDHWDLFHGLPEDVQLKVWAALDAPGVCAGLKVHEEARDGVAKLQELLEGNFYVCTAPSHSPYWVYERDLWLWDNFRIDRAHIIHTHCKYVCSGDFFLDDRPDHVERWQKEHPNGVGMLWSTSHNARLQGYEAIRVYSWDEVVAKVQARIACTSTTT